jgi:hypothetical protein
MLHCHLRRRWRRSATSAILQSHTHTDYQASRLDPHGHDADNGGNPCAPRLSCAPPRHAPAPTATTWTGGEWVNKAAPRLLQLAETCLLHLSAGFHGRLESSMQPIGQCNSVFSGFDARANMPSSACKHTSPIWRPVSMALCPETKPTRLQPAIARRGTFGSKPMPGFHVIIPIARGLRFSAKSKP